MKNNSVFKKKTHQETLFACEMPITENLKPTEFI